MTTLDGNTAALSAYQNREDARQSSYDALEPKAKEILMDRLLGIEPAPKGRMGIYATADHMLNEPESYGLLDADFFDNCIAFNRSAFSHLEQHAKRAAEEIIASESGQAELERIVSELETDYNEE